MEMVYDDERRGSWLYTINCIFCYLKKYKKQEKKKMKKRKREGGKKKKEKKEIQEKEFLIFEQFCLIFLFGAQGKNIFIIDKTTKNHEEKKRKKKATKRDRKTNFCGPSHQR